MLIFAAMNNEYDKLWEHMWERDESRFSPGSLFLLLLGCVIGTCIGYSSWWCRGKVSATSFTLIGVMNKCITVLANVMIWDKHASATGIGFLALCLVGGTIYQQAPLRNVPLAKPSREELTASEHGSGIWDDDEASLENDEVDEERKLMSSRSD